MKEGLVKDITGRRFGSWVVIGKAKRTDSKRRVFWICVCECGRFGVVRGDNLRRGKSEGCKKCMWGRVN